VGTHHQTINKGVNMRILRIAIVARTTVKDQDGKYSANYIENEEVKKSMAASTPNKF
jgi:hypothetical protein